MRIGIDARMYHEGLGIGRYIVELIAKLEDIDHENEYIIFLRKKNWERYTPRSKNFTKVLADIPWYSVREQLVLPYILYQRQLDVMHFPHFSVPFLYQRPFVVTIHDLIMLNMPASSRLAATTRTTLWYWIKFTAYRILLNSITRRACCIITVSETSKKDIMKSLKVPEDRVCVVYNGITASNMYSRPKDVVQPYFLCVGNAYPHKNLTTLLHAWKRLSNASFPYYLFFCGQEDYFTANIRKDILSEELGSSAFHLGSVSDSELAWLYENAVALVAPSLFEGFGLPAVEAISHSLGVIASDIPIFREILGETALYFDPTSPSAIAHALETFISQKDAWIHTVNSTKDVICQKFDWKKTAIKTLQIYKDSII